MKSVFRRAKRRARKKLRRELEKATNKLREAVRGILTGQVSPDMLMSLDSLFTKRYLSRGKLRKISSEGLDAFLGFERSFLERNPAISAFRRATGIPLLQPGGSAPRSIPLINMPPFQQEALVGKTIPDSAVTGLKAMQSQLVPLIDEVRVAEGIREAMDLSVPLASLLPRRFTREALSFHPEVLPERVVYEGEKDSPGQFRPLDIDMLSTRITKRMAPTTAVADVGFSKRVEDAIFAAQEIASGRQSASSTTLNIGAPQIHMQNRIHGSYSVEMMARDASYHIQKELAGGLNKLMG